MGEFISQASQKDYDTFSTRLADQLAELKFQIQQPVFSKKTFSMGAELEVTLVDEHLRPVAANKELLQLVDHPNLTLELNRYNLEINASPVFPPGTPFADMEKEFHYYLNLLHEKGKDMGVQIIPIGILPTLQMDHLKREYMTDHFRYHALEKSLCGIRGKTYKININGKDRLEMEGEGVTVEGANTSFQVHLQIPADRYSHYFNAAQLASPFVLALTANSPLVLGKRLWQESRIALFKQSVDFREHKNPSWRLPSRVTFGHGWLRSSAWELFAENVALFPPLLPILYEEDDSSPPRLSELCLHQGTIWPWNRAIYSGEGKHLRIESRYIPAGPSVIDMMANAALLVGFILGLEEDIDYYVSRLPFQFAQYNFYRSAQNGFDAQLIWPYKYKGGVQERPIHKLIEEFLPQAYIGLGRLKIDQSERDRLWKIIEDRFEKRTTGASWQLNRFEHYGKNCSVDEACTRLVRDYQENMNKNLPVTQWS